MSYTVEVTREGDNWLATVLGLEGAHTYAGNLKALDEAVLEVIQLVEDLPDDAPVEFRYEFKDVDQVIIDAAAFGARRQALEEQQARMKVELSGWISKLLVSGYSVRDVAGLLGISPGRVSQIGKAPLSESEVDAVLSSLSKREDMYWATSGLVSPVVGMGLLTSISTPRVRSSISGQLASGDWVKSHPAASGTERITKRSNGGLRDKQ